MSDRIDTDAIRRRKTALSRAQIVALCDEVDALRSREARLTEEERHQVETVRSVCFDEAGQPLRSSFQRRVLLSIIDRLVPVEEP